MTLRDIYLQLDESLFHNTVVRERGDYTFVNYLQQNMKTCQFQGRE
jgi:hypothetical protein